MNSGQSRRWGGQFTWRVFSAFFHAVLFLSFLVFSQSQTMAQGNVNDLPPELDRRLFGAIEANQLKAVKRIVGKGANILRRNEYGLTPVNLALKKGYIEIAFYLLSIDLAGSALSDEQISAVTPVPQTSTPRKSKLKSIALRKGNDKAGRVKKNWSSNVNILAAAERIRRRPRKK